jgi:hypothetical protein
MAEYTIPRSVMAAPPSLVTFPPKVAPVAVIEDEDGVVTDGTAASTAMAPARDAAVRIRERSWKKRLAREWDMDMDMDMEGGRRKEEGGRKEPTLTTGKVNKCGVFDNCKPPFSHFRQDLWSFRQEMPALG